MRWINLQVRWLVVWVLAAVLPAFAQSQPPKLHNVGILSPFASSADVFRDAFQQRLGELGYTVGRNVRIDYRASAGMSDRLPQLAAELVRSRVDVIVTTGAAGAQAARQATKDIPIV